MNKSHGARIVARAMFTGQVRYLLFFWAIAIPIFVGIGVGMAMSGHLDQSTWETAELGGAKYFPFVVGIMITPTMLPLFVAHGVTRRSFSLGAAAFLALYSGVFALIVTAGYGIEYVFYSAYHLPIKLVAPHMFSSTAQLPLVLAEALLVLMAHMTSGLLIGSGFYRLGWWFGLLFLIPAILPALAADVLLFTGWEGAALHALGIGHPPNPVAVPIVVALIAAGMAANLPLVRSVAIGRSSAGRYQMGRA
jgi:hypothetical protein